MSAPSRRTGRPAIEMLEQAIALLRRTPASALVLYYLGAVPFWLAFLYFVADASRSAFAAERLGGASFTVAFFFIVMKCWHAAFGSRLRDLLLATEEPWSWRRVCRLVATQTIWQPTGLIIRPLAYLATIPTVWVSSFYQNLTILGDGRSASAAASPARQAFTQATLWAGQAHGIFVWLGVFSFFVWLNVFALLAVLPGLLKMLLGWETMASRSLGGWVGNSTFPAVTLALTCLCIDPVWKAVFALRCFYGQSLRTGADLQVQLKGLRA